MSQTERYQTVISPAESEVELNSPPRRLLMVGGLALCLTGIAYNVGESDYKLGVPLFVFGAATVLYSGWWKSRRQPSVERATNTSVESTYTAEFNSNQHEFIHSVMHDIAQLPEADH